MSLHYSQVERSHWRVLPRQLSRNLFVAFVLAVFSSWESTAQAQAWAAETILLTSSDDGQRSLAVGRIAAHGGTEALAILEALDDGTLQVDALGGAYRKLSDGKWHAMTSGAPPLPHPPLVAPTTNNELRRSLEPALARLRLTAPDVATRQTAVEELIKHPSETVIPIVRKVISSETNPKVRRSLSLVLAWVDIDSSDEAQRIAALAAVAETPDPSFRQKVERLLNLGPDRQPLEKSAAIRTAANRALSSIRWRETWTGFIGNLFYGLSLGSVLLLVSLGLAITFGLMRVINMAHGELLTVGAYATFVVQQLFQRYSPQYADYYLVAAIPAAFVAGALVGLLIERLILRFLYGRPLETLLATWGVSLLLIQTIRRIFGAQNVTVANPKWLSGGYEPFTGIVLTYSRIATIVFGLLVIGFVWFTLRRTRLGLEVRAVTENREMAASMGIRTRRVDSWTFAVGAGVAGLGGLALSQLGNVGPELGQGYIIDAFMVVVLGGVGNLTGTLAGAFGLGIVNKLIEPAIGAVLGKIAILVAIIIFIQRRPQGLFALKGRAAEVG